jgi:acid phosphatase (class A)
MQKVTMRKISLLVIAGILTSCSTTEPPKTLASAISPATPSLNPSVNPPSNLMTPEPAPNYLSTAAMPSSLALVPPPPAQGSAAMSRDEEVNRSALTMHGTPRWELAVRDAVLTFPAVAQTFSCASNLPVSQERTPKLITLLRRTLADAGRSTYEAKQRYQRARPFAINGKPICTPDREAALRRDGSYPSGHSAIGWSFGLVLSEVVPDRANEVLARGRAFGQSRLVCNLHWPSDVEEGRMVASAVVARFHAEAAFRSDVEAARAEVAALRAAGAVVDKDCSAEADALKSWQ